jgi:hypothetical protein
MIVTGRSGQAAVAGGTETARSSATMHANTKERLICRTSLLGTAVPCLLP